MQKVHLTCNHAHVCRGLLTQRQAEAQSPCKVQGDCGPPEARQLRVGQRLGQLEDARHVVASRTSQHIAVEAAKTEREDALLASNRFWAKWFKAAHSLEAAQSSVALETLCKRRAALGTQVVFAKTATKAGTASSWATDAKVRGVRSALEACQGPALRQTRSKRKHPRHVDHFDLAIPVGCLADRHLAALVRHFGAHLE